MQNLTNWFIHIRSAWKGNSTETTVSMPTPVLMLSERMGKSAVTASLRAFEKHIVTDVAAI